MSHDARRALLDALWPLPRSITGAGLRATLDLVAPLVPHARRSVPTGTQVLDWTIPREWNLRRARLVAPDGSLVVDTARDGTRAVVNYSVPTRGTFALDDLKPRLHSIPDRPTLTPYRTSYYRDDWGFCLPHARLDALPSGTYTVDIDATLADGALTYGEAFYPGTDPAAGELLLSCHVCHPQLANDNLAGLALVCELVPWWRAQPRRRGLRVLLIPGTIGSLAWLAANRDAKERVRGGLVVACVGVGEKLVYKQSRSPSATDRAVALALKELGVAHEVRPFVPWGYDERQYGSQGFDLPVGVLSRTPHGEYAAYHTSADDLNLIDHGLIDGTLAAYRRALEIMDADRTLVNAEPFGEPQLGRRGLYAPKGGAPRPREFDLAMLWALNQCDGTRSLVEVAARSGIAFATVDGAARALENVGLLREATQG